MKERDMFYSDYQSGYMPNNNMVPNMGMYPMNNNYNDTSYYENRILKLERSVKRLESRVTRLENLSGNTIDDISSTDNLYMI